MSQRLWLWLQPYARRLGLRPPFGKLALALATLPLLVWLVGEPLVGLRSAAGFLLGMAAYLVGVVLVVVGVASRPAYTAVHRGGIGMPRTVSEGYAAVSGVATDPGVTAPVSAELTCAYAYRVTRRYVVDDERSYERTHEHVAAGVSPDPFSVEGTGTEVVVFPDRATIRFGDASDAELVIGPDEEPPGRVAAFLDSLDVDTDVEVRVVERRIDPGQQVTVVGRLTRENGRLQLADGDTDPAYVFAASADEVMDRLRRRVVGYLPAGALLVAAGTAAMWRAVGLA